MRACRYIFFFFYKFKSANILKLPTTSISKPQIGICTTMAAAKDKNRPINELIHLSSRYHLVQTPQLNPEAFHLCRNDTAQCELWITENILNYISHHAQLTHRSPFGLRLRGGAFPLGRRSLPEHGPPPGPVTLSDSRPLLDLLKVNSTCSPSRRLLKPSITSLL